VVAVPQPLHRSMLGVIHELADPAKQIQQQYTDDRTTPLTQVMATVVAVPQPPHRAMLGVIHESADPEVVNPGRRPVGRRQNDELAVCACLADPPEIAECYHLPNTASTHPIGCSI
jgi:hypothetical protein